MSKSETFQKRIRELLYRQVKLFDRLTAEFSGILDAPITDDVNNDNEAYNYYLYGFIEYSRKRYKFPVADLKDLFSMKSQVVSLGHGHPEQWYWRRELTWSQKRRLKSILKASPDQYLSMELAYGAMVDKSYILSSLLD